MKIKKLTWFAAFCSFLQYARERRMGVYLLANAVGLCVPVSLFVLFLNHKIGWMAVVGLVQAARLIFAPLDEYSAGECAYCNLSTYPLNLWEKLYVRLLTRVLQISEWIYAAVFVCVYVVTFGAVWGTVLAVLTLVTAALGEELTFYALYLLKNVKLCVVAFVLACIVLGVLTAVLPAMSAMVAVSVLCAVLVLCVAAAIILHKNQEKVHVLPGTAGGKSEKGKMPLSTRLMVAVSKQSALKRLVCIEWIFLLKWKVWHLVSALGYVVVFSVIDGAQSMAYAMVQYFIVDFCFLAGFNYFANIDDREGLFLFSTVDVKTRFRSKNLALGSVLLVTSTLLTAVLGLVYALSLKTVLLTLVGNVFCVSMMVLVSSLVSVLHFHLESSKKKYTVRNMLIMLAIVVVNSVLTALLLAGGTLGAVSLMFMGVMTLVGVYFSLIDTSLLEKLFRDNQPKMIAALQS